MGILVHVDTLVLDAAGGRPSSDLLRRSLAASLRRRTAGGGAPQPARQATGVDRAADAIAAAIAEARRRPGGGR
jgi:hypothetical protein